MAISLSLKELAQRIDGEIICGEASSLFHGMASLDLANASEISFLGNEKYVPQFLETKAGAVIVPKGHEYPRNGPALVAVENPSLSFSTVITYFAEKLQAFTPGVHPNASVSATAKLDSEKVCIHPGAVIMDGAVIGDGTQVFPNATIYPNVKIGNDCCIAANVTIRENCVLGDRVHLQPGCVIGGDGYGYEFSEGKHVKIPQVGNVEIGDDVEVGSNTTIDRARFGKTIIGEGTKIDNLVQIAHNCIIGKHCLIVSQSGIAGSTKLGDHVTLAAQAGITGHVEIGDKAIIVGRSGVTRSLEGNATYAGKPAIPMKQSMKLEAHLRRVPKLAERIKQLEKEIGKEGT